ncbi:LOW QUALITY PROTEIN: hypothetical protein KUTeg_018674 [Tegillarca granosa]|uniref:DUF7869 domain-containing protein n=1 Tax=Tegillarca granosa TaxID=220873 RepID=A0ABQ9EH69_TEGGR|nr:LOW QUALITY PROTEIN: hypothetical protein KUTeg_018674 [Tegillarca granosa]
MPDTSIIDNRINVQGMDKESRDMFIMGQLKGCAKEVKGSKGSETRQGERKSHKFDYQFNNKSICKSCFLFVNNINTHYLKNIMKHYISEGAVPRVHGNTGRTPKHAITYENVQHIVQYANDVGLPQPAAPRGRDSFPPVYLPGNETYKSVHQTYTTICRDTDTRILSETTFRRIWHRFLPHNQKIKQAVSEEDKLQATEEFSAHIHDAQQEREYYNARCKAASRELAAHPAVQGPVPPMSQNLIDVHYTFDFAQSFLLPSHCRQEGGLYFRSPYKAHMFGICNDGRSTQTNYIYGEDQCVGVDGNFSHSANNVISMLHHFFQTFGEGERICHLNADNCGGQNKNQIVTSYLAWRVANGLHEEIFLHFMKPYHARCLVDGMFGLVRRRFCQTVNDCLEDLNTTIELSSIHKSKINGIGEIGKHMQKPPSKPSQGFRNINISIFHELFPVSTTQKVSYIKTLKIARNTFNVYLSKYKNIDRMVKVKTSAQSVEKSIYILKRGKTISCVLPNSQEVGGLSSNRAWYLYRNIRPYVKDPKKDLLFPLPSIPQPESNRKALKKDTH